MSHLPFNQDKRVFLWTFLGSGIIFQVPAKGWGQCSVGIEGFRTWGWSCAGVWGTQEWVGKGLRNAQTRAGAGARVHPPALPLNPRCLQVCCSQTQLLLLPGLCQSPRESSLPCLHEKHSQAVYETSYGDELTFKTLHSLHFHL